MDRIICDICGTEFSGTAEICPNCGYPRLGSEKHPASVGGTVGVKTRGGRFSGKNVRKRQAEQREQPGSDRGLWITIILLLICIMLVSLYIALRFWGGLNGSAGGSQTTTPPATTAPVETAVPCTSLKLNATVVEMEEAGEQVVLVVKKAPEHTTDPVVYTSADPAVAVVSELGVITAVGPGQTLITVTCGTITKECTVVCWFPEETTLPPETTEPVQTTAPTEPAEPAVLKLDHEDVSLYRVGESFTIRVKLGGSSVSRSDVTWITSDPSVAVVENGVVTAVGPGTASIVAQYQGQKATCIVRCQFRDSSWRATSTDVTIAVGESFWLSVVNDSGERAEVDWSMDREGVVSVKDRKVTGLAPGIVTLFVTVDDVDIWCIVRVK